MDIALICENFNLEGKFYGYELLKSGNVNQTFLVYYDDYGKINKYVLQRINSYVFKDPAVVMKNVVSVTNHIRRKVSFLNGKRLTLHFLPSKNGLSYYIDENKAFWRVYKFIDDSLCFDCAEDGLVEEAGKAFGEFQRSLTDFDPKNLSFTIKDFHNGKKRYEDLIVSVKNNVRGRKREVFKQLKYLKSIKKIADYYGDLIDLKQLPLRVTHNDVKISNVLFSKDEKKGLAVIDLDTVMPGIVAYDFGDGARSIAATAKEDETDLNKVDFDLTRYEAFTKGFLSQTGVYLTENEGETLYMAPLSVTFELATRFLKDYLDGDLYFKCSYEKHNLVRANNQIALCQKIYDKLDDIKSITQKYLYT